MKKIENNLVLYWLFNFVCMMIAAMIIFPLLDILWDKFISHSIFKYNIQDYIIEPIIFAAIISTIYTFLKKKSK